MEKSLRKTLISGNGAVSPVIGVILMLLLTVLLAGITVSAVYGDDISGSMGKAPMAVIEIESVVGGVPYIGYPYGIKYEKNFIVLSHKGGDILQANTTYVTISGEGASTLGSWPSYTIPKGDLFVRYDDLTINRKKSVYASNNPAIQDGVWSAGENLVLNGKDGDVGNDPSSVHASVNGMTNNYDNYGLKENSVITIKVFDRDTDKLIAELEHTVIPAE